MTKAALYANNKIRNRVRCLKCGDIIESTSRYDYVTCSCKAVSVDGGPHYMRRIFTNINDWEEYDD